MLIELAKRVSHALWRRIVRRERRRRLRQRDAQERDQKWQEEQAALLQDPAYVAELERLERLEEETRRLEEEEAAQRKQEWFLRDAALHSVFLNEKQRRILQEEKQKKQEELIKKEWEEKQRKEEEEEKKKEEQLGNHLLGHHPNRNLPYCKLLLEVLERVHDYPEKSQVILLPHMYTHFGLEHLTLGEKEADIALEYSESETYQHFKDFFEDTLPEFQRCGNVIQFKVCCNSSPHLRGNVYIQYSKEEDAARARTLFNGRWYAGRQLTCLFVTIEKWKAALCGLYWRQRCPKGGQCNFLHAYRNPGNAFWRADKDFQTPDYSKSSGAQNLSSRSHSERSFKASKDHRSVRSTRRSRSSSRSFSSGSDGEEMSRSHSERSRYRSKRKRSRSERSGSRSRRSSHKHRRSRSRSRESGQSETKRTAKNQLKSPRSSPHRSRSPSRKSSNRYKSASK